MVVEWDPRKAAANLRKHGVGFAEAATGLPILWHAFTTIRLILQVSFVRS